MAAGEDGEAEGFGAQSREHRPTEAPLQLDLFDPPSPRRLDTPTTIKTPDDVYRIEVRLVFHPDGRRNACAIEVTHDGSRELISWVMLPLTSDLEGAESLLSTAWAEALVRLRELYEPF